MKNIAYLLFWALLFFVMMRFGCGAHMMGHGRHRRHSADGDRIREPSEAQDPVCGMVVETTTAKTAVHDGRAYYFCSEQCRSTFEQSPKDWIGRARGTEAMGAQHGTA